MASYNEAQVITQLKNAIKPFDVVRLTCETNSPNVIGLEDTFTQSLHSDYADQIEQAWGSSRSRLSDFLGSIGSVLSPIWRTWAQILVSPDLSPDASDGAILSRIYDRMITSGDRVVSRQFNFATCTADGGNAGNGAIYRLTQDDRNLPVENVYAEAKIARVIFDQNTGTNKHQEQLELRGAKSLKDLLSITGSGIVAPLTAKSALDSILTNPSFDQYDNAAAPTTINGWTPTTNITNFAIDTTNYYRGFGNDDSTTHQSVKFKANDTLTQLQTNFAKPLNVGVPVYAQVAWNRQVNACDGTFTFGLGSVSANVVLSAQAGWQILQIPINSTNAWYRNFKQQNLGVTLALSGSTTFGLLVDDVLVVFYDYADGWYVAIGGATPWLKDDRFTWTDTAVDSVVQRWVWRGTQRYLPAALPAPTAAAPTVALSATAGSVTTGTHVVAVTFVDAQGNESAPGTSSGTVTGNNTKNVDVTVIPTGPANITKRKLYMSKAGTSTPLYYAGITINDNVTTTATGASGITVADASLTVLALAGATIADP